MIVAIIPAKDKSTRLPNKNMYPVAGKPMIYYSVRYAQESALIDEVYVTTDSDEIAKYAESQDIKVIRRGPDLGGETPVVEVYHHALKTIGRSEITVVVGIQPDHPDRTLDVDKVITYLIENSYDEIITVDGRGALNGSLKLMKASALLNKKFSKIATMVDDCTNIHKLEDVRKAEINLSRRRLGK